MFKGMKYYIGIYLGGNFLINDCLWEYINDKCCIYFFRMSLNIGKVSDLKVVGMLSCEIMFN